ncbi:MAG: hypothetical protein JOZ41_02750 [Chloroflexi bacterium]|nr:hypothetical protein [Chloroflexota bacterium]
MPSRGARAVVLSATHDLVVGSVKPASRRARQAPGGALLTSQPGERAALTVAGPTTSVALFNPSHRAAHVTLSLVGVTKTSEVRRAIPPSGLVTMRVRSAASAARGVIVTSDVPVVAGPAS